MLKCEAEDRDIPEGRIAYAVSYPGKPTTYLIGHDGLVKNIPEKFWRKGVGYEPLEEGSPEDLEKIGFNFYEAIIVDGSGDVKVGNLCFSINALNLMNFPKLLSLFFSRPD